MAGRRERPATADRVPQRIAAIPFVDLTALLKIPTASRDDGLGTGEVDFGFEAELLWVIGKLMPFVSAGYRYLGSPPGSHLDDVAVATVGAQYQIVRSLTGGLLLDYRSAPTSTIGQRLEVVPYTTWLFFPPWSLDGYASAGLAQGSPTRGTLLTLSGRSSSRHRRRSGAHGHDGRSPSKRRSSAMPGRPVP